MGKRVSDRIRELREAKGWSLRELARRAGINDGHLSRIESGERNPDSILPKTLQKIAVALGTSPEALMEDHLGHLLRQLLGEADASSLKFLSDVFDLPPKERDAAIREFYKSRGQRPKE